MDLEAFAIDGRAPARVEGATTAAEASAILRGADRGRSAVVVWGGGTRIGVGDPPSRYDVALDMRSCRGVVEHSPADLVCTVRAGTTLRELADALAPAGQWWPVEVASPERATVGGTIASAAPGPSRLRHQHPRDWVIGCQAVLADGTVTRAGGRVVKNVTGYDLARLYSGSHGTLVAITEVTLKLLALPAAARAFRATGSLAQMRALAARVHEARLPLDALIVDVTGDGATLLARTSCASAATERVATALATLARFEDADPAEVERLHGRSASAASVTRVALPWCRELEIAGDLSPATIHVGSGFGYAYGIATAEAVHALRARIEPAGGAVIVERGEPALRAAVGTWGSTRSRSPVARRLKQRFDPNDTLAPGRM